MTVYIQNWLPLFKQFMTLVVQKKLFAMKQESCRKDVECAFGVLQSRFEIMSRPVGFWSNTVLNDIINNFYHYAQYDHRR